MSEQTDIHGTAIAVAGRAVLIRGRAGAGKSDLALRCLAVPAGPFATAQPLLVADDRVVATPGPEGVMLSAPALLAGLIEVRGVGIVRVASAECAVLALVADIAAPAEIERLPEPRPPALICGREIATTLIDPFEASAPLKLLLALAAAP